MGRETVVSFTDDMTRKPIDRTEVKEVSVIIDGWLYTLDLGATSIGKHIQPVIDAAPTKRRFSAASSNVVPMVRPSGSRDSAAVKEQNRLMREWWKRNSGRPGLGQFTYNERGRIPQAVIDAWKANGAADLPEAPPVKEVKTLPEALRSKPKPVAAATFSSAEPETKPTKRATGGKVPAARGGKAPAKAATPAASRVRTRAPKP
jgi:hypothetical protein